jgi:lipopolysaccharide assembly protein A
MRVIYAILLLVFVAAVIIFAVQNNEPITIKFLGNSWEIALALVIAAAYLLGMLSGWTVVGMLRRSLRRVTERE